LTIEKLEDTIIQEHSDGNRRDYRELLKKPKLSIIIINKHKYIEQNLNVKEEEEERKKN
jgi:hypothetical protein